MLGRERNIGKKSSDSSASGETSIFRKRQFFNQAEQEEVSSKEQKIPDLQTLAEQSTKFRASLSRMKVHGDRPMVQPQMAVSVVGERDKQAALTAAPNSELKNESFDSGTGKTSTISPALPVQAKLTIGEPGDKYEQEADRVAAQVVNQINAPVAQQSSPNLHQREMSEQDKLMKKSEDDTLQMRPMVQLQAKAEMGATPDLETSINLARSGGQPLDKNIREPMEQAFGADFSRVKVHTDAQSDELNQSMQARAFTTGQDVFFRHGEYNPGSRAGQELLGHELTHVVQQNGGAVQRSPEAKGIGTTLTQGDNSIAAATTKVSNSKVTTGLIQRDIGFEFETKNMYTKKSNTGNLPPLGFPHANAANAVWFDPRSTRVAKGQALLRRADVEVQADDNGDDSDLEVVTTHFPLDAGGRNRLNAAMGHLTTLVNAYTPFMNTAQGIVPAVALNGSGGFNTSMRDGMFLGNFATATTAPQVTFGTRVRNVADIVRDLHGDPHETALEKTSRDPGRLHMRRPNPANVNEPRALTGSEETDTLISGRTLASDAITAYQVIDGTAPGGPALEGLLTIVFSYCESMQHKRSFLKNHTPLMAKTNLATIFTTLPGPVQTYYSQNDHTGKSNLEKLVETAPGYSAKMNQPLFAGVDLLAEDDQPGQPQQWYHGLTLESWLRGIVLRDRTKGEAFAQFFKDNHNGSTQRRGKDQLTNKSFPNKPRGQEVEGYGALGKRMDQDVTNPVIPLPIFELRSASRPITYPAAQQWALDFFDYIQSLNANPGGGHTLMP